MLGMYHLIGDP